MSLRLKQRLASAETEWLAETSVDAVSFELFEKYPPKPMRRHKTVTAGLAELGFGVDENPEGIWLAMLVAESPGAGSALMERIKQIADKYDLSIEGVVNPMKPTDWDPNRPFVPLGRTLVEWHLKRGFQIVGGDPGSPRVRYSKAASN
jgi:hypothetical protein